MNSKLIGFFSGFPTHHFTDDIVDVLKKELVVRDSLVFVSAWPNEYQQNNDDSNGMHEMFAERNMPFKNHYVIDHRTTTAKAISLVRNASCIFLMGGHATQQMQLMHDKNIFDEIRRSSAVILGVSAGSMNMGKHTVDIYESLTPYDGLGFSDITIKAHYPLESNLLQKLKQISMTLPVCAMTDESAIFIRNTQVTCAGEIHWIDKGIITEFSSNLIQVHEEQNR